MMRTNGRLLAGMLVATVVVGSLAGCGAVNTPPPPPPAISVSLSVASFTVPPQATTQFTATVKNDPSGKGVTWSITSCNGAPTLCGSVSPAATASGAPTTYTAPGAPGVTLNVALTATSVADPTKFASVAITVPTVLVPVSVTVSPQSATVLSGATQQFTATVGNDPNNAGVTWRVVAELFCNGGFSGKCNPAGEAPFIFLPCNGCGTFSAPSTPSGAPTTYTAPAHVSPPSQSGYFFCSFCSGVLFIVATSVTNTSASNEANLTLPSISVSLSPSSASVALNGTQKFTATVKNDGTNKGVNWSLTENNVPCSPACGTISPTTTASGAPAIYSAPASAPVSPSVRVTATSAEDPTASAGATLTLTTSSGTVACSIGSGSESLLKGQYAFLLQGDLANFGEGSVVGSFTADGTGRVTGGEEDLVGPETLSIDTTASSYAVGADHRGCMVLTGTNGLARAFFFSLGSLNPGNVATSGHIMAIPGDISGPLQNAILVPGAAGTIRLQDPSSFTAAQFNGNYAVGFLGSDAQSLQNGSRRVAIAGTFTADGVSAISSATFDVNDVGAVFSNVSSAPAGTFTCCDANGRGALTLASLRAPNIGFYMVNSADAFLVANDNNADAIQGVGEAIAISSGTNFSQTSLSGTSVLRATAQSVAGAVVDIATLSADGKSTMTENDNVNNAGTFNSSSTQLNYTVASNGRVTLTGGNAPAVLYLYGPNQGFLVGTDPSATFGILEPQAGGPFSNASFSGAYMFGTENPSPNTVTMESGILTADGNGNATGTVDQSSSTGLTQNKALKFAYSFPANGIGNIGSNTTAILISGSKLVFINNTDTNPTITVVEK